MFRLLKRYNLTNALADYVSSSETSTKTQWNELVNKRMIATSDRLNLHRISIREDLYRYKSLRIPCKELKLWQLSYLYPDRFFDITSILHIGCRKIESRECSCC